MVEGSGHDFILTESGKTQLARLGIPFDTTRTTSKKRLLYACVDWSERRDHFAGPLAVAMLETFIEKDWLQRCQESRQLKVTKAGRNHLLGKLIGESD